ncbi:hypothetical protein BD289DRAFT_56360 [Coniella lustricola]|uniref:Uncharacterized protein n=1 Tax=Coniella lustricola TaxID=2025994 RepID=A0A2T3AI55_9PEZI|nr:hypothetical protein BD289DRAFT_56360 [Coniella lustricola]
MPVQGKTSGPTFTRLPAAFPRVLAWHQDVTVSFMVGECVAWSRCSGLRLVYAYALSCIMVIGNVAVEAVGIGAWHMRELSKNLANIDGSIVVLRCEEVEGIRAKCDLEQFEASLCCVTIGRFSFLFGHLCKQYLARRKSGLQRSFSESQCAFHAKSIDEKVKESCFLLQTAVISLYTVNLCLSEPVCAVCIDIGPVDMAEDTESTACGWWMQTLH